MPNELGDDRAWRWYGNEVTNIKYIYKYNGDILIDISRGQAVDPSQNDESTMRGIVRGEMVRSDVDGPQKDTEDTAQQEMGKGIGSIHNVSGRWI